MQKIILIFAALFITLGAHAASPLYTQVTKQCLSLGAVPQAQCVFEILTNKFPKKGQILLRQIPDGTEAAEVQGLIAELAREMAPIDEEKICADLANAPGTARAACIEHHKESVESLMRIHSLVSDLWVSAKNQKLNKMHLAEYAKKEIKDLQTAHPEGPTTTGAAVTNDVPTSK